MAFYRPTWAPRLSDADVPDDIPLFDFLVDDRFRPRKCQDSPPPFVDGVSGQGFGIAETRRRVEWLAAGLARQLGISDFSGEAWQRVVGVFAVNNVRRKNTLILADVQHVNQSSATSLLLPGRSIDSMASSRLPTSHSKHRSL